MSASPLPGEQVTDQRPRVVVVGLGPAGPDLLPPASVAAMATASRCFLRTARHPAAPAAVDAVLAAGGQVTALDDVYEAAADFDEVYWTVVERVVAAAGAVAGSAAGETRAGPGGPAAGDHPAGGLVGGDGTVCLAVPGSPLVAERVVDLLRARSDVALTVVPAPSFLDLAWAALGVDPLDAGVRIVDAAAFAVTAAGQPGPFLVGQCHDRALLSGIKLAVDDVGELGGPVPAEGVLLHHLGLPDQQVLRVPWADIDRVLDPDHLTTLWVPVTPGVSSEAARMQELVRVLRERCPWDRQQTHRTLAPHLIEEAYEAVDAMEAVDRSAGDPPAEAVEHLLEELGDVAFQVYFHAQLAAEAGWFTVADVLRAVHDKLVHRHPHVFGDAVADTAEDVAERWEQRKQQEKGRSSVFDGIPPSLPALAAAAKVQRRAEAVGTRPSPPGERATPLVAALAVEVAGEVAASASGAPAPDPQQPAAGSSAGPLGAGETSVGVGDPERLVGTSDHLVGSSAGPLGAGETSVGVGDAQRLVGDALFAVVDLARRAGVDPESALRVATAEFRRRAERGR